MTLYDSTTSPFCRKVSLVIHELGLTESVTSEIVSGNAVAPGTMPVGINPLGKIPCLVRDEGPALYDSRVICAYLNAHASGTLYGEGASEWDIRTLEATADGLLDAAILIVYEARLRPDDFQYEPWMTGQLTKITRALDAIEARWMPLLQGPLTLGHIAVASALGYLDFRQIGEDWREVRPHLAAWYERFATREAMVLTEPHG
ncbi:MAG: glutathione S-transferase [Pseudomonadota bacterium]